MTGNGKSKRINGNSKSEKMNDNGKSEKWMVIIKLKLLVSIQDTFGIY